MMKPYLLIFRELEITREEILMYIDSLKEILDWYAYFPNAVFLISKLQSSELAELLKKKFNELDFLVTEIPIENKQGMLAEDLWFFINDPERQIEYKTKGLEIPKSHHALEYNETGGKSKDNKESWLNIMNSLSEFFKNWKK